MKSGIIYLIFACLSILLNAILGHFCFKKKDKAGVLLGLILILSSFVTAFYTIGIFSSKYLSVSIFNSLYFIMIDLTLICTMSFMLLYTENDRKAKPRLWVSLIYGYSSVDMIILILNPFLKEFAADYTLIETVNGLSTNIINMKFMGNVHLIYCYLLVAISLFLLVKKLITAPSGYKLKFILPIFGILGVVVLNAIYLFVPKSKINYLDFSLFGYSITALFIYWCQYYYSASLMVNRFKASIFDNIEQGFILFDYNDKLLLKNKKIEIMLPFVDFKKKGLNYTKFLEEANINIDHNNKGESFSLQCFYLNEDKTIHPFRCDFKLFKDRKNKTIGKLLTIVDYAEQIDILTGFHNWDSFKKFSKEYGEYFYYPLTIGLVDINGLALYNELNGYENGDKKIKELSQSLMKKFPKESYFVRGRDATLIVISYNLREQEVKKKLKEIKKESDISLEYACVDCIDENISLSEYFKKAFDGLLAKKLLATESTSSSILSTLIKTLEECDPDTQEHVQRTQKVGQALGLKIGLSDVDLSNLNLLCLLHDIGKVGIPTGILNKPAKLTDEEYEIIKTHVEKGYNIALSSPHFKGIAQMILYHHERWDGKGYPEGLSRESIPLLSRIISIVDAFDAMVSDRCYRKALPFDVAKEEIKKNAGTQFDPFISSVFLKMIEENDFYERKEEEVTKNKEILPEIVNKARSKDVLLVEYSKYTLDSNDKVVEIDEKFTEVTGYTNEDIKNQDIYQLDLIPDEDRTDYSVMVQKTLANSPIAYFEHRILTKDKKIKFVICLGRVHFDNASREMRSEIFIVESYKTRAVELLQKELEKKDAKKLKKWEETYRRDSLTDLLTHQSFQNDVETLLLNKKHVAFIMIDLDNFKFFNDTYGHRLGDEFLISVAQSIRSAVRDEDLCSRMGGDEFAIAISGNFVLENVVQDIFARITMFLENKEKKVGLSMGATENNDEITTFNQLYEKADKAMYKAKENGKNCFVINK